MEFSTFGRESLAQNTVFSFQEGSEIDHDTENNDVWIMYDGRLKCEPEDLVMNWMI